VKVFDAFFEGQRKRH